MLTRALALLALLCASGCVMVKPWQRERLASPAMTFADHEGPSAVEYRAKLRESRTATTEPGSTAGGGCGCTQ